MEIAVTGASGFIGTELVSRLRADGHRVRTLVRRPPDAPDEVRWDPAGGSIDAAGLAGVEAVVNLAGEGIATKRWSDEQKRRILESRTQGTTLIARTVAAMDPKPRVLLNGSGIDFYGDRGDERLTEASGRGNGFLADVVVAWEAATAPAAEAGIRTAFLRSGIVQSPKGGSLARQLPLFRFGLGGRLGKGDQWWSWISLDDEVGAIAHLLDHEIEGPVNLTGPGPVTNAEFTSTLGAVLHRPTLLPTPSFGPRLLLGGELADTLLYESKRVLPAKLTASGYRFRHPTLEAALRAVLDKEAA
jgi:uncharacterized protein (TIGR01777 family)